MWESMHNFKTKYPIHNFKIKCSMHNLEKEIHLFVITGNDVVVYA